MSKKYTDIIMEKLEQMDKYNFSTNDIWKASFNEDVKILFSFVVMALDELEKEIKK